MRWKRNIIPSDAIFQLQENWLLFNIPQHYFPDYSGADRQFYYCLDLASS